MLRWTALEDVPPGYGPSVVTLGNFDGVHRGHQAVLAQVCDLARARGAAAVAVTFDPHPRAVLHPESAPPPIMALSDRLDAMAACGLHAVLVQPFTRELAQQTPEEYVRSTFVDALGAVAVVIGADVRFGIRNSGDLGTMRELGERFGFEVVVVDDVGEPLPDTCDHDTGTRRWSSSQVRDLVAAGKVTGARGVLGRAHAMTGTVVHGQHRGRELGYPTANLSPDATGMTPADGVYAGWLERLDLAPEDPDRRLPAAISVGTNPTFAGERTTVEAYCLDRDDLDLYDERVTVEFVERLRGMEAFASVDDLLVTMAQDVARSREILGVQAAPVP